jgi:lipopolysaccharide assembly outer membrane protein LptD (OstA)
LIEQEKQRQAEMEAKELEELNKELNINYKKEETSESSSKVDPKGKKGSKTEVDSEKTLELEGGVKEHVTSNDVTLDADNIDYDDKTMDIIATGSPVLFFPPQNVTIKADKLVYNNVSNVLKAYGKVEVIRDGHSVFGDYLQINLNEENAFMDNIETKASMLTVRARKSEMEDDKIILHNGKMSS